MPNKRQTRNGYFYFVLEKLPELRRRGLPVSGVRDAVPHCSADWALLSMEEKEKYSEMARQYKADQDAAPKPRITTVQSLQQKTVMTPKSNLSSEVQMTVDHDFPWGTFYFINILSHGELPPHCEQRFLPCEIGSIRYTLSNGILDCFHHFIDPGAIPRGFRFHCQAASDSTHQIPLSGFELASCRYHSLFRDLCTFVNPSLRSCQPIYCKSNEWNRVNWCLDWLATKAGMENKLKLLHVEDLIVEFYQYKIKEEPSKTRIRSLLDVFQWDYSSNTRCKWHEENDVLFCALASCKKIAYCISSALAPLYEIPLSNAHLPLQDSDPHNSMNPKMVVLDAGRFQVGRGRRWAHCASWRSMGDSREKVARAGAGPLGGQLGKTLHRGRKIKVVETPDTSVFLVWIMLQP
ncbi:protein maelstrom homolog isoform X2 [Pleurodeles waltl]|uniref:protein maelstrom homolog isoform X2 n=1 Tax=Pleurodeles waltl TaxID=8319 RepID=UPI003709B021